MNLDQIANPPHKAIWYMSKSQSVQKVILLVEDDPMTAAMEEIFLQDAGFEVMTANSGTRAVELALSSTIDLVLMDIDLGAGMDGTEAASRILSHREIPLIFLSSHIEPEVVERTERITSYGYIVKSPNSAVLLASVRMAFRLYESREHADEQERFFRGIFEQAPVGMQVFDPAGNLLMVNQAAEALWQVPSERLVGSYNILTDPQVKDNSDFAQLERAFRGEMVIIPELQTNPAKSGYEGRIRVVRTLAFPIIRKGRVHRVVAISQDMTDAAEQRAELVAAKEQAEAGSQHLALLLELAPDAFFQGDTNGLIISVNSKATELTGHQKDDLVGMNFLEIFDRESITAQPLDYAKVNAQEIVTRTRIIRRRDGSRVHVEMSSRRMPDGSYQSFVRDITRRREDETAWF
jgi:PAS domain S-box-containing protein